MYLNADKTTKVIDRVRRLYVSSILHSLCTIFDVLPEDRADFIKNNIDNADTWAKDIIQKHNLYPINLDDVIKDGLFEIPVPHPFVAGSNDEGVEVGLDTLDVSVPLLVVLPDDTFNYEISTLDPAPPFDTDDKTMYKGMFLDISDILFDTIEVGA